LGDTWLLEAGVASSAVALLPAACRVALLFTACEPPGGSSPGWGAGAGPSIGISGHVTGSSHA
jgi:hypothetical protein